MVNEHMNKQELRAEAKALRKSLKDKERDERIASAFFASPLLNHQSFFVYLSFGSEAGTELLVSGLLSRGKTVCVPRTEGEKMFAVPYSAELEKSKFGTFEPTHGEDMPCEVALVPLLFADRRGVRLGYGGGFYDRYFAEHKDTVKAGVCYEGQIKEALWGEEHDIPLDYLLTEKGLFKTER